jgi:hypothetical protein
VTGFVLRAPWYVRKRAEIGLLDPAARRPALQMYDGTDFARRIVKDPRDSLEFGPDDLWTYPIPVTPSTAATGRARLATWQLVSTDLRKLYQPSHDRFYAVVVEVLCDQPGLPRAGSHDDIEVRFVLRRRMTSVTGARGPSRRVASNLVREVARQHKASLDEEKVARSDERDLWWADQAWRHQFAEDNRESIDQLTITSATQGWFTAPDGSRGWSAENAPPDDAVEESFPMWRLPPRDDECDRARTRSTWFGLVPTYSAEHSVAPRGTENPPRPEAKLDDHAIYEIHCFVRRKQGKKKCPPEIWWNEAPSEPFRLAAPMDPQGTSKRLTSITLPDLRRLAARAGLPMGPGGVAITTPPQSQLVFNPFGDIPKSGEGRIGAGGGICTFALELFFIVAFFLFLMFLPIVVFAFQLWWMLALRFCIPPSIGFDLTVDFLADLDVDVDFDAAFHADAGGRFTAFSDVLANLPVDDPPTPEEAFDQIFGTDSSALASKGVWITEMSLNADFTADPLLAHAAAESTDPADAVASTPPDLESAPPDPLCPDDRQRR